MLGNLILGRTAVPRATPQFEAQLHANLIQAGLRRVCRPGACARPRVLAEACLAAQDWVAPQRLSSSRPHRVCPDSQELAMSMHRMPVSCSRVATHLQPRTRPLSCVPRCSQERPAPTLHFRRRRLQVWLHRCCNQGVRRINNPAPPQPAGSESSWLIAASLSSECPYTLVPVTTARHSGFRNLACKLRPQAWHDVACPQSQQQFFALFNAQARLRCGDLANVDISQVRPPTPGARLPTAPVNWQASLRVATHTGASIPDSVRIMCREVACAKRMHAVSAHPAANQPAAEIPIRTRLRHGTA